MKLDAQDFLRLTEAANSIVFWDVEATGLRGDYNSIVVASVKPYKSKPITFTVNQAGNDRKLVGDLKECLEKYDAWVTYYGKGFDVKMLDTRLLKWGLEPVKKKPHIDMYFSLKTHLLTARRSQGHLLSWLGTDQQKMGVGADMWNEVLHNPSKALKVLSERCETDCIGLQGLYEKTKHLLQDIKR